MAERKTKVYGSVFMAKASDIFINDQKKMEKQGWKLVSCTEIGKDRLNAIYERGGDVPALNVPNLQILLGMLQPNERTQFEAEVQVVVNRWLARKATQ